MSVSVILHLFKFCLIESLLTQVPNCMQNCHVILNSKRFISLTIDIILKPFRFDAFSLTVRIPQCVHNTYQNFGYDDRRV